MMAQAPQAAPLLVCNSIEGQSPTICITFFGSVPSRPDPARFIPGIDPVKRVSLTWSELLEELRSPEIYETKDRVPLWSFATYELGLRRRYQNVTDVQALFLDFDDAAKESTVLALLRRLTETQVGHCFYTTHSYNPGKNFKLRAMIKLSRPVTKAEWPNFFARAVEHLEINQQPKPAYDPRCPNASHAFYLPAHKAEAAYECGGIDGSGLDVDQILLLPVPPGLKAVDLVKLGVPLSEEERGAITPAVRERKLEYVRKCVRDGIAALETRKAGESWFDIRNDLFFHLAHYTPHVVPVEELEPLIEACGVFNSTKTERAGWEDVVARAISDGQDEPWWPSKSESENAASGVGLPLSEDGLALRFRLRAEGTCYWSEKALCWYTWIEGKKEWRAGVVEPERLIEAIVHEDVPREAQITIDELKASITPETPHEEAEQAVELIENLKSAYDFFYKSMSKHRPKIDALKTARRGMTLELSDTILFNANADYLLRFENGIFDCKSFAIRETRKEDYQLQGIPIELSLSDEIGCPLIERIIFEYCGGDQEKTAGLWREIGNAALQLHKEPRVLLLTGYGGDGKSTLLQILLDMFGTGDVGYGAAADTAYFMETFKAGGGADTRKAALEWKRLIVVTEPPKGGFLDAEKLKQITGGDTHSARKLYEQQREMIIPATVWLAANTDDLPRMRASGTAIRRRLRIYESGRVVVNEDGEEIHNPQADDIELRSKAAHERQGFWKRVVKEAHLALTEGMLLPASVQAATDAYLRDQSPVADFVEDCLMRDPDGWISRQELRMLCDEYRERRSPPLPALRKAEAENLFRQMTRAGFKSTRRKNDRGFGGCSPKPKEAVYSTASSRLEKWRAAQKKAAN